MKKIINGKMYNTETARHIANWGNGCSYSDFNYCEEDLYQKKTGEFFLHGRGGARSSYAESCGQNTWTGGSDIIPLTKESTQDWLESHDYVGTYIELFGEPEE